MSAEEKAVEETAKTVRHYLDPVLQNPLGELGLLLRDRISYWRFKNQVNAALKAKAFLESKSIDPKRLAHKVSPEIVVPLLEASGEAADATLSDMFASLLAGAIDPDSSALIHPSFAKVLSQLSSLDAHILNSLFAEIVKIKEQIDSGGSAPDGYNDKIAVHRQFGYDEGPLAEGMKSNTEVIGLTFDNLKRIGLCDEGQDALSRINKVSRICLTDYGLSFMRKCTDHVISRNAG